MKKLFKIFKFITISYLRGVGYGLFVKGMALYPPSRIMKGFKHKGLKYLSSGSFFIDDHAEICIRKLKNGPVPKMILKDGVFIGRYNILSCTNEIVLEENVLLAPFVFLIDNTHNYQNPNIPIRAQGISSPGPIRIKQGTWLGAFVQVLGGVTIGRNCVIASGSIVNKDIPDYSIAAGTPAKVIKRYDFELKEWVRVDS